MIDLHNICKNFGNRVVLKNINFSVGEGDIVSIMGKSGSGKTTLLNILGFLDAPTSGIYFFNGKPVLNNYQRNLIRNEYMGFVFQSYNLIPKLTVYENIALPIYYSIHSSKIKERIKNISVLIEQFHLNSIANSKVEYISGGEKQRVCLARALVCDAKLIISDEPTGNLDDVNTRIVLNELKRINSEGKTVIIVTHDKLVENIATKKFLIESGKLERYDG